MNDKPVCNKCSKTISGIIKIDTGRRKLGRKSMNAVDFYDEECFKLLNKEKAMNELQEERNIKKKNKR